MARKRTYVVCYDIEDNRRRRRIASILENSGMRVQESVFEVRLSQTAIRALINRLGEILVSPDSLRSYPVPDPVLPYCTTIGGPSVAADGDYFIV